MAPSSFSKQTAGCELPHDWLMSLAMDLAASKMAGNPASYLVYSTYNELLSIAIYLYICGEICAGSSNHSRDILN